MKLVELLLALTVPGSLNSVDNAAVFNVTPETVIHYDQLKGMKTTALAQLAVVESKNDDGLSDTEWRELEAQRSYWRTVHRLIEIAEFCGEDSLPVVSLPPPTAVIEQGCADLEWWIGEMTNVARRTQRRDLPA